MIKLIDTKLDILKRILYTLTKNPNRRFITKTLLLKRQNAKDIYREIENFLLINEENIKLDILNFYIKDSRNLLKQIEILIDQKLGSSSNRPTFKTLAITILILLKSYKNIKTFKMASILDIIKTASTLIPEFDGRNDKLEATLDAIRALNTLVTDENRNAAISVTLSKLSGKARSVVGANPVSLQIIIDQLTTGCRSQTQPEVIQAKLNALKQTGELNKFTEQIEILTLELEKCFIANNIPANIATRMATKAGVKALANGVRNQETRTILKSGTFENLVSAVEKAIENDNEISNIFNIQKFNNRKEKNEQNWQKRGGYQYRHNYQRNNQRGGNNSHSGFYQGNNPRGGFQQNHRGGYQQNHRGGYQQNHRGGYPQNHRGGYQQNPRGGYQQNNRVFFEQLENQTPPQQQPGQTTGGGEQTQQRPQIQFTNFQTNASH